MNRDIEKLISEYEELREGKRGNFGSFYASEIEKIKDLSKTGSQHSENTLFVAIGKGLKVGFMVGYKAGLREAGKKQHRNIGI